MLTGRQLCAEARELAPLTMAPSSFFFPYTLAPPDGVWKGLSSRTHTLYPAPPILHPASPKKDFLVGTKDLTLALLSDGKGCQVFKEKNK